MGYQMVSPMVSPIVSDLPSRPNDPPNFKEQRGDLSHRSCASDLERQVDLGGREGGEKKGSHPNKTVCIYNIIHFSMESDFNIVKLCLVQICPDLVNE